MDSVTNPDTIESCGIIRPRGVKETMEDKTIMNIEVVFGKSGSERSGAVCGTGPLGWLRKHPMGRFQFVGSARTENNMGKIVDIMRQYVPALTDTFLRKLY